MSEALKAAKKGMGRTAPNPPVGAVVVKNKKIISTGWHKKAGANHAEIEALKGLSRTDLKDATLYVTLEPCSHFGKTPPCTDAIIKSGIKKVYIGTKDLNRNVGGNGIKKLTDAGIEVSTGILKEACTEIIEPFNKFANESLPFVNLKIASTLDGKIALKNGKSRWITGEQSRKRVHEMRSTSDAVLTGLQTVIKDDPALTVRHIRGKNPVKVVLDDKFKIPLGANIFKGLKKNGLIIFVRSNGKSKKIKDYEKLGATVIKVPLKKNGLDLKAVLKELAKRNIMNLMVECGSTLAGSFLKERLVDRVSIFLAPKFIGSDGLGSIGEQALKNLDNAVTLTNTRFEPVGEDIFITGLVSQVDKAAK